MRNKAIKSDSRIAYRSEIARGALVRYNVEVDQNSTHTIRIEKEIIEVEVAVEDTLVEQNIPMSCKNDEAF
jgi:hypothetical protein